MAGRRGNGEGSVYKAKIGKTRDGKPKEIRWRFSLTVGDERVYGSAKTQADAIAKLQALKIEVSRGFFVGNSTETVRDLVDYWLRKQVVTHDFAEPVGSELRSRKVRRYADTTKALWTTVAERYIYPRIGRKRVRKLRRKEVQEWVDAMVTDDCPGRMRQLALAVLRKAFRYAIRMEKLATNPTDLVDGAEHEPEEIFPFTAEEAARIMRETAGERWHALVVLSLSLGMRIGELLGLPWKNLDLKAGEVHVRQQAAISKGRVDLRKPKTKCSIRTISLTDEAVAAIQDHRAIMLREGHAGHELVFPSKTGRTVRRTNFARQVWLPLLEKLKLDPRGFHHTRHTYATLALKSGVPVHVVSKVMGHEKPSTTLNIYGHVLKGQQNQSTEAMSRVYGDAAKLLQESEQHRRKSNGG